MLAGSDGSVSRVRRANIFVIAAWAATIFGLLEGVVQCIIRDYPAISAAHKVSPDVVWVAATLDLSLFLFAAAGLIILARLTRRWFDPSSLLAAYGFFIFLGVFPVSISSGVIHPLAAFVLSVGVAKICWHELRGYENQLTTFLRHRLIWIPVALLVIGLGVANYEKIRESWPHRQLPTPSGPRVNVLLIVMDTVRYDSFTRSAQKSLTPNLNHIVAKGISFDNAWATSSWSLASQASILTGRYPHEHGADWPHFMLDPKYPTLAEFFTSQGYVTGAFSGNSAWVTPEYLGQGFLRFDVYVLEDLLRRTVYGRILGLGLRKVGYHESGRGKKAPTLNRQFLKFINDYHDRPFFAYLCYMDVNQYFHDHWVNSRFLREAPMREVFQAYEDGLKVLDSQIADLLDELGRMGILKNTLVVITSDHGQSFGAAETNDHDPLGHGTSLYPEQTKVPLFVVFPGKVPAGKRVTHDVSTRAIAATITQILGLSDSPFNGAPLVTAQQQETSWEESDASVLATLNYDNRQIQMLISDRWQYIKNVNGNKNQKEELYNLRADPLARNNLAPNHAALSTLRDLMRQELDAGSHGPRLLSMEPAFKTSLN
jgi:arylsulfatase A-like enzyme